MSKPTQVDVMVVYSHTEALSPSIINKSIKTPFAQDLENANYNDAYEYFLKACKNQGLEAVFATSDDIVGPGMVKRYWKYNNGWIKVHKTAQSNFIFDKLSPTTKEKRNMRNMLFSRDHIQSINSQKMYNTFFDKYKTYQNLSSFTLPTVAITDSVSVYGAIGRLNLLVENHNNSEDFSHGYVLKDRYGAGGNEIYAISGANPVREIEDVLRKDNTIAYILQPFAEFDRGHEYIGESGHIDTRLIYLGNTLIQAYTRTAEESNFRCNEHQGGSLDYIKLSEIPDKIISMSEEVCKELDEDAALYALDYIISNNGTAYLLEGNCGPGIDWDLDKLKNEVLTKVFIRKIVENISERIDEVEQTKFQKELISQNNIETDLSNIFGLLPIENNQASPSQLVT